MIQVGSLVYAANALNKEVKLNELDPENEIRRIRLQVEITLISTAAAFALALADYSVIAAGLLARVKGSWNFDDSALSLTPSELRTWSLDSQGADPQQEDLRVGDSIPISTGAAIKKKFMVDIDFTHNGMDTPNLFCPSSDQFNASAAKLNIDLGTILPGGSAVVLANGSATIAVTDFKVLAEYSDAFGVYVAPHFAFKLYGEGKERDSDLSPGVELFLAQESDPTTFEGVFSQLSNMDVDGRARKRSVTPTTLALDYLRTSLLRDSLRSYDITRNSVGGQGSVVTPISWVSSRVRSAEHELPYRNRHRKLEFTVAPGAARAYQFMQVKTAHIGHGKTTEVIRKLSDGKMPDALEVRGFGGADNGAFKQFKGRIVSWRNAA